MPPLEWSIVQSLLLTLVLPSFSVAIGILVVVYATTRSEVLRSGGAAVAMIASIAVGNFQGGLVPFLAVVPSVEQLKDSEPQTVSSFRVPWEFETGWYSLFSVTVIAILAEVLIDWVLRHKRSPRGTVFLCIFVAAVVATWSIPWKLLSSKPWTGVVLAGVILLNTLNLRDMGQSRFGHRLPLVLAVAWGGSATMVTMLAHSARFADLSVLLGSSLAAIGIVTYIAKQPRASISAGTATFISGLMLGTALNTYSDISSISFALVALAPGIVVIHRIPMLRDRFEFRPILLLVAFLIPCGIAVGLAIHAEF